MDAFPDAMIPSSLGRSIPPQSLHLTEELSPIDQKLIQALQIDGRQSYAKIARDQGLTEKIVRSRVRELRVSGIIDIITVIDPELLGYNALALVGITTTADRSVAAIAADVARLAATNYVAISTGRYHLLVELACRDLKELLLVLDTELARVPGVATVESHPFLRLYYQQPEWRAAQGKREGGLRQPGGVVLSPTDMDIIRRLNDDGRAPYPQIADELSISESAVRQRVNRLRSSGTLRIMAIANPTTLGFQMSAWLGISVGPGVSATKVADALIDVPSITYLAVCGGRFDILAEAVCRDNDDLLRVLDNDVRQLPGVSRVEPSVFVGMSYNRLPPASNQPRHNAPTVTQVTAGPDTMEAPR
jgi:Lrp/AsnC family transcriptional regulator for asnA, asnC and gidA